MRKIVVITMMVMSTWLVSQAQAKVFSDSGCMINADNNGNVSVSCPNSADLGNYNWAVEFCPDQIKYSTGCGNDLRIDADGGFQLDMSAIKAGQRAFNFKKDVGTWSHVMGFKAGKNLVIEMSDPNEDSEDGRGGCHYTFVGDLPAGSYVPYKPELCGGGYAKARKGGGGKTVTVTGSGGGENNVSVRENEQGAVAVASKQSAAAAHNSAAATNQSSAANNSSEAVNNSFLNMNIVKDGSKCNKKGKKSQGGDVNIQYAPNAYQANETTIIKGSTFDIKNYNLNKNGKSSKAKKGTKHVPSGGATAVNGDIINYNPMYITIHQGVKGAKNYNANQCVECHSDASKKDAEIRDFIKRKLHNYTSAKKGK